MSLLPSVTFIWQFKFFHKFLCLFYLWTVKYKYSKLQLFTGSSLFWFVSCPCIVNKKAYLCWLLNFKCVWAKKWVYTTICVFFNRHVHHMTFFCVAKIFGVIKLFMTILMYKHKSMTPSPAVYASVVSKHVTFLYTLL